MGMKSITPALSTQPTPDPIRSHLDFLWQKMREAFFSLRQTHTPDQNLEALMKLILASLPETDYGQAYVGLVFDGRAKTTRDAFERGFTLAPPASMQGVPEAFHLFLCVGGRVFDFDLAGKTAEPVPHYLARLFFDKEPPHVEIARLPIPEFLAQARSGADLLSVARGESAIRSAFPHFLNDESQNHPGLSHYEEPPSRRVQELAAVKPPVAGRFWAWLGRLPGLNLFLKPASPPVDPVMTFEGFLARVHLEEWEPNVRANFADLLMRAKKTDARKTAAILDHYGLNEMGRRKRNRTTVFIPTETGPAASLDELSIHFDRRPTNTQTESVTFPDLEDAVGPISEDRLAELKAAPLSNRAGRILSDPLFTPVTMIRFEGREIYLSQLLRDDENRKYMLALVRTKERVEAFLYYASQSGGSWRYTTGILFGTFFKGFGASYTQETQPLEIVLRYLQDREEEGGAPVDKAAIEELFNIQSATPATQVFSIGTPEKVRYFKCEGLKEVQKYRPGTMFVEKVPTLAMLESAVQALPAGFVPDFAAPCLGEPSTFFHQMLGACLVFRYESVLEDRRVFWDLSVREEDGLGWVNHIHFADAKPNRFGGRKEVIDTGFVTSKPVEYRQQLEGILDFDSEYYPLVRPTNIRHYLDIREILAQLSFMRDFYNSPDYKDWNETRIKPDKPAGGSSAGVVVSVKPAGVPVTAAPVISRLLVPSHALHSAAVFVSRVRHALPCSGPTRWLPPARFALGAIK